MKRTLIFFASPFSLLLFDSILDLSSLLNHCYNHQNLIGKTYRHWLKVNLDFSTTVLEVWLVVSVEFGCKVWFKIICVGFYII